MDTTATRFPTTGDRVKIDLSRCQHPEYHIAKFGLSAQLTDISDDAEARADYAKSVADTWTRLRGPLDQTINHLGTIVRVFELDQNRLWDIAGNALSTLRTFRADAYLVSDLFLEYGRVEKADPTHACYQQAELAGESYNLASNAIALFLRRLSREERRTIRPPFDFVWESFGNSYDEAVAATAARVWSRPDVEIDPAKWEDGKEALILGRTDDPEGPFPGTTKANPNPPDPNAHVYRVGIYEITKPGYAPIMTTTDSQFSVEELEIVNR